MGEHAELYTNEEEEAQSCIRTTKILKQCKRNLSSIIVILCVIMYVAIYMYVYTYDVTYIQYYYTYMYT